MRAVLVLLIALFVPTETLIGQAAKTQPKPPAPCRVSGRVVAELDGAPLKSSRVVLIEENVKSHPKVFGATTDADGRFEIKDVVPGRYNFVASHVGYVDRQYKAQSNEEGAVLSLQPGEEFSDALFRLVRAGVIAGHILDENGEPLSRVVVSALRKPNASELEDEGPKTSHKEELITASGVLTDDRGEFRLYGLEPGSYYVKASETSESLYLLGNRSADTEWMVQSALGSEYVPLYYPGVTAFDEAQTIAVRAGEEMEADFNMRHVLSAEISGKVIGHDGRPTSHAMVRLESGSVSEDGFGDFSTTTGSNGEFSIKNVPPGSYRIVANEYEDQKYWKASQKIDVGERKIDSLVLALGRGSTINGRVTFAGKGSEPDASRVFIMLSSVSESDDSDTEWALAKKDGSFEILDVPDGSYSVQASCRESGWFTKSIRFGPEDALEKGLQVEKGSTGGTLEVVFGSGGAVVDGSVTLKDKPAVAARVVVHPDPDTPYNHTRARSTSTDQNGHFSIPNIAPGRYRVTAKLKSEVPAAPMAVSEPQSLTLHDNDRQSLQLTLEEPKQ